MPGEGCLDSAVPWLVRSPERGEGAPTLHIWVREAGRGIKPQSNECGADPGSSPHSSCHSPSGWGPIHPCPTPGQRLHEPSPESAAVPSVTDKELLQRGKEEAALHVHCGQVRKQLVWIPVRTLSFSKMGCAKPGSPSWSIFLRQESG